MRRLVLALAVALSLVACGPVAKASSGDQADMAKIVVLLNQDAKANSVTLSQVRAEVVGQMRLNDGTVIRFYHVFAEVDGKQPIDFLIAKATDTSGKSVYTYTQSGNQLGQGA